ncbi:hypothetical protein B5X24_HaOG211309 [Helicoverpa armigera]|uniref:Major facilitator superfamily (MFS) profile domain-containing protein n=1 Tax=Helicoverpa armigera TaxID=29058 RepID=A0A2W1BD54_HELAM|nr:hypothetical protein B5X24_HaOG211309 [Helicoverpa armigera]
MSPSKPIMTAYASRESTASMCSRGGCSVADMKLRPPPDSSAESTAPPDGGYGWVVVFGAFMVQFWVAGLFKSYGVLYVEIMETFPDSSESVASWIPAALSTLCLALGIGGGLSTTPGIVIVSQYFDKHRALANGICVSGTAAGSFVFPMLIEKLVDMYGLHGTVLLLGGGMLHVCVSATLYRPAPVSFNTISLADRTPATTTTTENTTLLHNIQEAPVSFNTISLADRTPATTTTTENTTLLHNIQEDQGIMFKSDSAKDNRLESLFHTETELTLNQKNLLLNEEIKRNNLVTEIMHPSLIEVARQQMQSQHSDSEDSEGLDVLGVVGLPKEVARLRLRPTRSSSILHSVEDLSTDSTCVYKARRNLSSKSLYIRPPPSRLIPSKLAEPIVIKPVEIQKEDEVQVETKTGCVDKISRYLDVSLLRSWRFGVLCASVALMSCGSPYALYYLPAYTVAAGHSKSAAGHLVAISAVLDLCGRLGLGYLCDLHLFCRRKAYIVSILVAGIAVLTLPSLKSWWALAIASGEYKSI